MDAWKEIADAAESFDPARLKRVIDDFVRENPSKIAEAIFFWITGGYLHPPGPSPRIDVIAALDAIGEAAEKGVAPYGPLQTLPHW